MTKHILGISAGFHDASATIVNQFGDILFASHSERYSKKKNDSEIDDSLITELQNYDIDTIALYERPWLHNLQQWYSGQKNYGPWTTQGAINKYLKYNYSSGYLFYANALSCVVSDCTSEYRIKKISFPHHLSHAAAGFQTSPYTSAAVVVIDAIGELDTVSIYKAYYDNKGNAQYKRVWKQKYPHSIGLFYSAITARVGLRPSDEEYITMGMAAYGQPSLVKELEELLISSYSRVEFKENLHTGLRENAFANANIYDLAASAQFIVEKFLCCMMKKASELTNESNVVYSGGVALNCLANRLIGDYFNQIWIMPNPGDAGSSLGAAALAYKKKLNWIDPYLGYNIAGHYPATAALDELLTNKIVGVASGPAEFGPRALGNRSLLADPRGNEIKDKVNEIKRRQKFRPFAPVILSEYLHDYFEMPTKWESSPYMQVIAKCKNPDLYPAIVHYDGTSRVQTVDSDCRSGIRQLLEEWYAATGCPMLLNTSLNIRGEPIVNDRLDADRFEELYKVKVVS